MPIRNLIFSCPVFGGFKVECNVKHQDTLEDIVQYSIDTLRETLRIFNFECLIDELNGKLYHIHDRTIADILTHDLPVYICECTKYEDI